MIDATRIVRGPQVLRSRLALTAVGFWLLLGLAYFVPGPTRDLLRSRSRAAEAQAAPAMPTVASSGSAPAPAKHEAVETTPRPATSPTQSSARTSSVQSIEDPHRSLSHVARAFQRTTAGKPDGLTRVLHLGDSQIDLDHITSDLRKLYQRRYGDAGLGVAPVVKPWRWFYLSGVVLKASEGWSTLRLAGGNRKDGRLGLGGLAALSDGGARWAQIALPPGSRASSIELAYLTRPGGGSISVVVDGKTQARLSSASKDTGPAFHRLDLADTRHVVTLRTRGRVRLLGISLERPGPGVTWENLPMVGTRFDHLARLEPRTWQQQLRRRNPALVIFQFGANDTISFGGSLDRYGDKVGQVLSRLRTTLKHASCLVIGPLDRVSRDSRGKLVTPKTVGRVAARQRAVAMQHKCAFWNAHQAMGGPESLLRWAKRGLVRKDGVHLNKAGSAEFARLLDLALRASLRRFDSPAADQGG